MVALIVGVANENSIAWGIAKHLKAAGHSIIMTYQNEKTKQYTEHLAAQVDAREDFWPLDLMDNDQLEQVMDLIECDWGKIDVIVHAVAFAPKQALSGRVVDVTEADFYTTMGISCHSLIKLVEAAEPLMAPGASVITVSYLGAQRVVDGYGIMGVAKAALEASARALAFDLGHKGIRVNVISPGPIKTCAAGGVPGFDDLLKHYEDTSLTGRSVDIDDVGKTAVWLVGNKGVTGQTIFVDDGYSVVGA